MFRAKDPSLRAYVALSFAKSGVLLILSIICLGAQILVRAYSILYVDKTE